MSGLVQDVRWLAAGLEDEGDLWDTSGAAEEAVAERSRAVCNLACALCLQSRLVFTIHGHNIVGFTSCID